MADSTDKKLGPQTEADHFIIEAAMANGFGIVDDDVKTFSCTDADILSLVKAVRPTTVYVVTGFKGEYSDYSEWVVCVLDNEEHAKQFVVVCERACRDAAALADAAQDRWFADDIEYDTYQAEVERLKANCPDPSFDPAGSFARRVSYTYAVTTLGVPAKSLEGTR